MSLGRVSAFFRFRAPLFPRGRRGPSTVRKSSLFWVLCSAGCCDPGIRVCVGVDLPQPHGCTGNQIACAPIKERLSDSKALRNAGVTTPCARPAPGASDRRPSGEHVPSSARAVANGTRVTDWSACVAKESRCITSSPPTSCKGGSRCACRCTLQPLHGLTSARSCGSEHQEAAQLRVLDCLGAAGLMAAAVGSAESTCSKWLCTPRSRVWVMAVWDAPLWPGARWRRAPERHAHSLCIVPLYL